MLKQKKCQALKKKIPEKFYEFFLITVKPLLAEAKNVDDLVELLDLNKAQLNAWLKQAVEDKKIKKLSKPVRYEWSSVNSKQGTLL